MAVQTSYSTDFATRIPGVESSSLRVPKISGLNKLAASAEAYPGRAYKQNSSPDDGFVALASASDKIKGIAMNDMSRNPSGLVAGAYATLTSVPMAVRGPVTVEIDQDCGPADAVYVRFAASAGASTGAIGSFRKDADGVANVVTATPTAVNGAIYVLRVKVGGGATPDLGTWTFEAVGDGSATATEICTALRAAMQADTAFNALVASTGSSTLILTGATAGVTLTVNSEGDGAIAVVNTTPAAPTARLVRGARWCSSGTAAVGVGELDFDVLADF